MWLVRAVGHTAATRGQARCERRRERVSKQAFTTTRPGDLSAQGMSVNRQTVLHCHMKLIL